MKAKIITTLVPTLLGIAAVLALLVLFNVVVHRGDAFQAPDNGFFSFIVPVTTAAAIIIQFFLTLPVWQQFKTHGKVLGLSLVPFTVLLCLLSGLLFGLVFWERSYGPMELLWQFLTGFIAFSVYWAVNLFVLKRLL